MDGDGTDDPNTGNDVLQAGSNATACSSANYFWYEWYTGGCTVNTGAQPCAEWEVSDFPINTGDYLYVMVFYSTGSPNGTAYFSDQSTGQYISIGFNQPTCLPDGCPGSAFAGYSAEWIVERPGTSLTDLTPVDLPDYYVPGITPSDELLMSGGYLHFPSYYSPGFDTSGAFNTISMFCNGPSYGDWSQAARAPRLGSISQTRITGHTTRRRPLDTLHKRCISLSLASPKVNNLCALGIHLAAAGGLRASSTAAFICSYSAP
jgi:hypothetical protein